MHHWLRKAGHSQAGRWEQFGLDRGQRRGHATCTVTLSGPAVTSGNQFSCILSAFNNGESNAPVSAAMQTPSENFLDDGGWVLALNMHLATTNLTVGAYQGGTSAVTSWNASALSQGVAACSGSDSTAGSSAELDITSVTSPQSGVYDPGGQANATIPCQVSDGGSVSMTMHVTFTP